MQIHPVRTEEEHDRALARISQLMGPGREPAQSDELEILATLVEAYEAKNFPIDPPTPVDAIVFRMEQQGLTRKDLEPLLGSREKVAEILAGKRRLTLGMIRRLQHGLGIPAAALIGSSSRKIMSAPGRAVRPAAASRVAA